ncbi:hypothetical protein R6Q59_005480 [Mikania micrantha]
MLASTAMNILKVHSCYHLQSQISYFSGNIHPMPPTTYHKSRLCNVSSVSILSHPQFPICGTNSKLERIRVSETGAPLWTWKDDEEEDTRSSEDLTVNGDVYQKTLRLVECSMFAALGGLTYILSSSLAIENYFGCFFALPIVFSSMRWDIVAGRKTMVATATLLLVLAGPIKALTYLLMHGFLGLSMGSLWRSKASWGVSVLVSAVVRAAGAMGYVLMYSFLIRENILALVILHSFISVDFFGTAEKLAYFNIILIDQDFLVDHHKHSCLCYIYPIILRLLGNPVHGYYICHFWDIASHKLLFLCVPATSSICPLFYKAWNEVFPKITKMVR